MDVVIPIVFLIFGFLFLILALHEDREEKGDEDEEERSGNMVIILLIAGLIFFAVGGFCMRLVTNLYYSPISDTIVEVYAPAYQALSWIGYGFAFLAGFLLLLKAWERIDFRIAEE